LGAAFGLAARWLLKPNLVHGNTMAAYGYRMPRPSHSAVDTTDTHFAMQDVWPHPHPVSAFSTSSARKQKSLQYSSVEATLHRHGP
jgi:hypothetical protein